MQFDAPSDTVDENDEGHEDHEDDDEEDDKVCEDDEYEEGS